MGDRTDGSKELCACTANPRPHNIFIAVVGEGGGGTGHDDKPDDLL